MRSTSVKIIIKNHNMKKIMFNDKYGLTKAVLEGRKIQTRRIIKIKDDDLCRFKEEYYNASFDVLDGKDLIEAYVVNNTKTIPYKVGDIVAVAQSYKVVSDNISETPSKERAEFYCKIMKTCYPKEEIPRDKEDIAGWTNKMFVKPELMPHQIRTTNVRIERLNDISDNDCLAEGIIKGQCGSADTHFMDAYYVPNEIQPYCTPKDAYVALIDKVGKKGDWDSNPYVFVYDFELIK